VVGVKVDSRGKMDVAELDKEIQKALDKDFDPFLVSATAGTTVLGAFDPIDEIAKVCTKYGLWLHVDGAWGGGALMSETYKTLMKGIEK
jgi:glutamate/tyrosine decarboxylase-like PLP-dependent enzyme